MTEPKLRVASRSQEHPGHRRAEHEGPREIPLTTEALAARGDSLQHLRRRLAASMSRSAGPGSSSTAVRGSEEQDELRRGVDEYLLHGEYHKSVRGEDGEEPLEALGSPPHTDMGSYHYSGPPTDVADTTQATERVCWASRAVNNHQNPRSVSSSCGGFPSPGANLSCPGPYGRTTGLAAIWVRRSRLDSPV